MEDESWACASCGTVNVTVVAGSTCSSCNRRRTRPRRGQKRGDDEIVDFGLQAMLDAARRASLLEQAPPKATEQVITMTADGRTVSVREKEYRYSGRLKSSRHKQKKEVLHPTEETLLPPFNASSTEPATPSTPVGLISRICDEEEDRPSRTPRTAKSTASQAERPSGSWARDANEGSEGRNVATADESLTRTGGEQQDVSFNGSVNHLTSRRSTRSQKKLKTANMQPHGDDTEEEVTEGWLELLEVSPRPTGDGVASRRRSTRSRNQSSDSITGKVADGDSETRRSLRIKEAGENTVIRGTITENGTPRYTAETWSAIVKKDTKRKSADDGDASKSGLVRRQKKPKTRPKGNYSSTAEAHLRGNSPTLSIDSGQLPAMDDASPFQAGPEGLSSDLDLTHKDGVAKEAPSIVTRGSVLMLPSEKKYPTRASDRTAAADTRSVPKSSQKRAVPSKSPSTSRRISPRKRVAQDQPANNNRASPGRSLQSPTTSKTGRLTPTPTPDTHSTRTVASRGTSATPGLRSASSQQPFSSSPLSSMSAPPSTKSPPPNTNGRLSRDAHKTATPTSSTEGGNVEVDQLYRVCVGGVAVVVGLMSRTAAARRR
ncbi:hypothetical protein BC832DRAFT_259989 [Gaertneriomyces semiglobifer]|nr:hypothetical protein BC832DRAFT_259989 [Gaertneriomyces semiglobifer]